MNRATRSTVRVLAIAVLTTVARAAPDARIPVTPVEGPSTLHHLGLSIEHSSMGWDGQWGSPPQQDPSSATASGRIDARGQFIMTGADLYRISCRPCHKPDGSGAPPEINSLLGPVQAASLAWMTARMRATGRPVDPAFVKQLTAQTETDLRARMKRGGHNMPAFDHLSDAEIDVLRQYLDVLAGVPPKTIRQLRIVEPADRVGELITKGTCHICHDAAGAERPVTVLSGVIPSLASMPHQKTAAEFVRKVRDGSPVPLNGGGPLSRGRMPQFSYLTETEIGAAYSYLLRYPPR